MKWSFSTSPIIALNCSFEKKQILFWDFLHPLVQRSKIFFYRNQVLFHSLLNLDVKTKIRHIRTEKKVMCKTCHSTKLSTCVSNVLLSFSALLIICCVVSRWASSCPNCIAEKNTNTVLRIAKALPLTNKPNKSHTSSLTRSKRVNVSCRSVSV